MRLSYCATAFAAAFLVSVLASPSPVLAQATSSRPLITAPIDEARLVTLAGNTRPEANAINDRGPVSPGLVLNDLLLQLQRAPADEATVARFIDRLHDAHSPLFHRWLTASEYGQRFGLAQSDINKIAAWLMSHGFTVNRVYPSRMMIDFSGTAGEVTAAFHTEIHRLDVGGVSHFANMSDPRIPAALASAVAGITALHDFRPHNKHKPPVTAPGATYTLGPGDLATIYNFNPVFKAGITGKGITVAVAEDTSLYDNYKDWHTFVSVFRLGTYGGTLTVSHPGGCSSPGANGDEGEAALDAQWATAAAPGANILFASCGGNNGVTEAIVNLINQAGPPPIISVSYGVCETEDGAAANKTYFNAYQQAVAEGISVFVATGDNGPSDCAGSQIGATVGIGLNGWASTIYNVAVGGTDFSDTYSGTNGKYWKANTGAPWSTAKSYIPEIPWNGNCGSTLLANYGTGSSRTYGSGGFCNIGAGASYRGLDGGEGAPSGCATGKPAVTGVVGGTCKGYAKPSWQSTVYNNPKDGVRDGPDVAMFAAAGAWNHYLDSCLSDPNQGGSPCTGNPSNWVGDGGGTSYATPIVAGIQALVNQSLGLTTAGVGNPNTVYYQLAAKEYATAASRAACNASKGTGIGAGCVFNNITFGDDDSDCKPDGNGKLYNCYRPSGALGVLSTSNSTYVPAFKAAPGYSFPTGLGSINVANLIANWPKP